MNLYFVFDTGTDDDGDRFDHDYFVAANDPDEAVRLWRDYWREAFEDRFRGVDPETIFPDTVFLVPAIVPESEKKPCVWGWHTAVKPMEVPTKEAARALGLLHD